MLIFYLIKNGPRSRRKFVNIVKTTEKTEASYYAVAIIAKLYKIANEIKEKKLNFNDIENYRKEHAEPILLEFKILSTLINYNFINAESNKI